MLLSNPDWITKLESQSQQDFQAFFYNLMVSNYLKTAT